MLILHTPWGTYILNNAIKIDVFKVDNKSGSVGVYISIDSSKHLIQTFECSIDAIRFVAGLSGLLESFLYSYCPDDVKNNDLMHLCEEVLSKLESEEI